MAQNSGLGNGRLVPQLFTSVPALSDAASYLTDTTSYITSCFPGFSDQDTIRDGGRDERELLPSVSEQSGLLSRGQLYLTEASRSDSGRASSTDMPTDVPESQNGIARGAANASSDNSGALVVSTSAGTGISLFQGLIERARRTVHGSADDIGWLQRDPAMPPVEDGTERFMEILDSIGHGVHRLPKSMIYLLVPGDVE